MSIEPVRKRIRLTNEKFTVYECLDCDDIFRTNQLLNNHLHRLNHKPLIPDSGSDTSMEDMFEQGI